MVLGLVSWVLDWVLGFHVDRVDDPEIVPRTSVGLTSDVDWALTYVTRGDNSRENSLWSAQPKAFSRYLIYVGSYVNT